MNVDAVPYREQSALLTEIQPFLLEDGVVEIIVEMNVCFGSSSAAIMIGGDDTVTSCGAVVIESSPQVPPLQVSKCPCCLLPRFNSKYKLYVETPSGV